MTLTNITGQFLDVWAKLTILQRVSIIAATVAVVVAVTVLVVWSNKPAYQTLYADMTKGDIEEISGNLQQRQIVYKVNGNAIEVAKDTVYDTRMALAAEGLPRAKTVGFELFDEPKFGMTEQMQNVNFQRALQGEISKSISTLNEVAEARVLLTIPKDRIFGDDESNSKASVVIKLKPGAALRPDQVKSISYLVASAVKGLVPQNVQIVDTAGSLLSEFLTAENQPYMLTQTQLERQKSEEKRIENGLKGILTRVVGEGNYVLRVNVDMDFNKRETMKEEFGDTPVVRSQRTLEINSKNMGKAPQGIPGVESNLAEPNVTTDSVMSEYSKTDETQNFEINKTVTREEKMGGEIKRMTVAVVVNDKDVAEAVDGKQQIVRKPRTEEDIAKLKLTVANAAGIDAERGDVLDVSNISFDTADSNMDNLFTEAARNTELITRVMQFGGAILILLFFFLFILRPILKRLDKAREIDDEMLGESAAVAQMAGIDIEISDETGFPKTVEELEREIEAELEGATPLDVEAVKSKVMLKKIEEQANEDPELIANLVKVLIKGGN